MQQSDLDKILQRKGYAIQSQFKRRGTIVSKVSDTGEVSDLERGAGHESIPEKRLALAYTGRCHIRVKVFRRRLTDPLGDCHKYHIDSLRYHGLLKDDTDAEITLLEEPHQKVESDKGERVEITMEYENVQLPNLPEAVSGVAIGPS